MLVLNLLSLMCKNCINLICKMFGMYWIVGNIVGCKFVFVYYGYDFFFIYICMINIYVKCFYYFLVIVDVFFWVVMKN